MTVFHFGEKLVAALEGDSRKRILRVLSCGERNIESIAEDLRICADEVRREASILQDVNLVESARSGSEEYWRLMPDAERIVANFLANNHLPASEEYCKLIR